ncbi:MAG: HD-GYP domain-containing protein [Thermoguttaceae bacterium]|nr:HD-GYP domain-containing protein [Thermoguttaceae bacterium]MDW8079559.1 HD-GYP domain-containing protein [Thermoguttaceae bacterium]
MSLTTAMELDRGVTYSSDADLDNLRAELREAFGGPVYLFDAASQAASFDPKELPPPPPLGKLLSLGKTCYREPGVAVHRLGPLSLLELQVGLGREKNAVAVGLFPASRLAQMWAVRRRLLRLGFSRPAAQQLAEMLICQPPWPADALLRAAKLFLNRTEADTRVRQLERERQALTAEITHKYEEIALIHRLAQNLRISQSDEELAKLALEGMHEAIPAQALALLLFSPEEFSAAKHFPDQSACFFVHGDCPLDSFHFFDLARELEVAERPRPVVLNGNRTSLSTWRYPEVRQLIMAPVRGGKECFGFFAAINHTEDKEFGSVEANLLASVATILGTHSANILLYRQQEESLAGIIRALTSAIDAKDTYTCGHSDRVARIAVRLAQELGVQGAALHTIYLAGLLHDIGKIGTSEAILRKPGKLTPEEYEHIKQHVRIGYRILMDLKHLSGVLPAVLHHHEHWDGSGYPAGLAGEEIPLPARIIAVADAFDAMASDRPYRRRLPDEKIDAIFREGAGKQWDPQVVEVFFRIREELEDIVLEDRSSRASYEAFPTRSSIVNGAVPAAVLSPLEVPQAQSAPT